MQLDVNIIFRSNVHVDTIYLHCPVVRPLLLALRLCPSAPPWRFGWTCSFPPRSSSMALRLDLSPCPPCPPAGLSFPKICARRKFQERTKCRILKNGENLHLVKFVPGPLFFGPRATFFLSPGYLSLHAGMPRSVWPITALLYAAR